MTLGYGTAVGIKMQGDHENDIADGLPIFWMCYGAKESDFKVCSEYAFYRAVKKQEPKVMEEGSFQQGGGAEEKETVEENEEENVENKEGSEEKDQTEDIE